MSSRPFLCVWNICLHQQQCAIKIFQTKNNFHAYIRNKNLPNFPPYNFPSWRRYTFLHVRLRNHKYLSHQQKPTICEQFPLVQNGRALFIKVSLFLFKYLSEFFAMEIFPQHCLHGQSKIS